MSSRSRSDRHVRAGGAAALLPARDDRRRAGRGEEPPLRRALRLRRGPTRAHPLAPGALPSLRGRDRVLGARRDRQGGVRDPRVRLAGGGGGEARAGVARRDDPDFAWLKAASRSARRRGAASRPRRRSRSRPGGVCSSRGRSGGRRCSSSRTCTGRTRRSSPSSSTSPTGRQACRCFSSARPARSCTSGIRASARTRETRRAINLAPLSDDETATPHRRAARAGGAAGRDAAGAARARGRKPPVRGGVRAPAHGPRRAGAVEEVPDSVQALIAARLDTLSPDAQEPAPGRGRAGQGVLGRRAR